MGRPRTLFEFVLAVTLASPAALALPPDPAPTGSTPLLAPLSGFSDEGAFSVYVNEERVATVQFKWTADGAFTNERTLSMAGQSVAGSIRIAPEGPDGWQHIALETPLGPVTVIREGTVATKTDKNEVETINLKPGTVLFENFAPALMSQAIRQYDHSKGGKQTLPVFILPKIVLDSTIELLDSVERSVAGRDIRFTRYVYGLPGVDITLWADDAGKIYLADVPPQHAAYVREGYERLLSAAEPDPTLSRPTFTVKEERGLEVPMRDGAKLSMDVYRPEGEGRFPVILVRTPYQKEMAELDGRYYARRGYVFAAQDCRGRFSSGGEWEPFVHEAEDGFDTIEWLAEQPWSSGKVGMFGSAYLAWLQWSAAALKPPHLAALVPLNAMPDPLHGLPYDHGVFALSGSIAWTDVLESKATADLSGRSMTRIREKKYSRVLRGLPVIELDKAVLDGESANWRRWIAHPPMAPYWERARVLDRIGELAIPVYHQSGWFDAQGMGTKLNYAAMAAAHRPNQKLILGPWGQTHFARRRMGDRDFGPDSLIDLQRGYLRWFDRWLKGVENGIDKEPPVSVFVMGSNKWLRGEAYPLPQTRWEKLYLASAGRANTSFGNGRLMADAPRKPSPPDTYTYDPGDPTPDPNAYESPEEASQPGKSVEQKKKEADAYHESVTRARQDILVYTSDRFKRPLTFAGPLQAVLYASSSARDTDWFVRLIDVDEAGKLFQLAEGKLRARYRKSVKSPELLEPGEVCEYTLDLGQTGITIPPGNRLRVEVASASFPTYSPNLNTGGHNETETQFAPAEQTIYHDPERPSHVVLPVIPDFDEPKSESGRRNSD